ncbi:MAG TPA: hypothetical protein DCR87_04965, partial [Acidobacteria bacterium]|nr:hypothetical protein [Acidobacteriota bacterium]
VAGYKHTGKKMYLDYAHQLLWHTLEANKKMKEATGGRFEFCGHYNTYSRKFYEDDDGLVVVSNLYEMPYLKIFEKGARAEHFDLQEIWDGEGRIRLVNPTNSRLKAVVHLPANWKTVQVLSLGPIAEYFSGNMATGGAPVEFTRSGQKVEFQTAPMSLYQILMKE